MRRKAGRIGWLPSRRLEPHCGQAGKPEVRQPFQADSDVLRSATAGGKPERRAFDSQCAGKLDELAGSRRDAWSHIAVRLESLRYVSLSRLTAMCSDRPQRAASQNAELSIHDARKVFRVGWLPSRRLRPHCSQAGKPDVRQPFQADSAVLRSATAGGKPKCRAFDSRCPESFSCWLAPVETLAATLQSGWKA